MMGACKRVGAHTGFWKMMLGAGSACDVRNLCSVVPLTIVFCPVTVLSIRSLYMACHGLE